jgi:hypothetical protein
MRRDETKSCVLSTRSMSDSAATGKKSVAKKFVMRQTTMPTPETVRG